MAYWHSKIRQIIYLPDRPCLDYPGWVEIDCGCCGGTEWGGDVPQECRKCKGNGVVYRHTASRVLAESPGGLFLGKDDNG